MTTKEEIIHKIKKIDDPELLQQLDTWLNAFTEATYSDEFRKEEIAAVAEGYEEYLAGEVVSNAEANKLFKLWLKEK